MTPFQLSHVSALSVLFPLAVAFVKWPPIWRKFPLLLIFLFVGGLNDLFSYLLIKSQGANTINGNLYQLVEFVLLVWLFKRWPSSRKNHFHLIILVSGTTVWILDNFFINSLLVNSSIFRVVGSMLLVYTCTDQINYSILNRESPITISRMLIKIGFVLYFFYKAFIESFDLLAPQILYPYSAQFWYVQCLLSIVLNVLITIAFLCYRSKPTRSILTSLR